MFDTKALCKGSNKDLNNPFDFQAIIYSLHFSSIKKPSATKNFTPIQKLE